MVDPVTAGLTGVAPQSISKHQLLHSELTWVAT